jgi:hypothetical protein
MAIKTTRLSAYLALEREMLMLDDIGDPIADSLRDAMDALWYGLSDEEHELLDNRTVLYSSNPVWTISDGLFEAPVEEPALTVIEGPLCVLGWEYDAA